MKFLNEKKDQSSRIILPDRDGIASLDIRRMKSELEGESESREMCGYMPVDLVKVCVTELKKAITAIENGEVSSLCFISIMPKSLGIDEGAAFFSVAENELPKLDELFHASLAQQPKGDPDEAG